MHLLRTLCSFCYCNTLRKKCFSFLSRGERSLDSRIVTTDNGYNDFIKIAVVKRWSDMALLNVNQHIAAALVKATNDGLGMANLKPEPVGITTRPLTEHMMTSLIGFVGKYCGTIALNIAPDAAEYLAGKILGSDYNASRGEIMDGVSEITNIIAGKAKAVLSTGEYVIEKISVPTLITGKSYEIGLIKGMTSVSMQFQLPESSELQFGSMFFSVSISLIRV